MSKTIPKPFDPSSMTDIKILGSGSFGTVYKAFDKNRNTTIVFKELNKTKIREEMVMTEIEILSSLEYLCQKKVLCFLDFMENEKNFYIITEYLGEYSTLDKFIDNYTMKNETLVILVTNMLNGLVDIHNAGVAHRDIKPDNIMVNPVTLEIKYIDFGLSCMKDKCNDPKPKGTPLYMAPELIIPSIGKTLINDWFKNAVIPKPPSNLQEWFKTDYWSIGITILSVVLGENILEHLGIDFLGHEPENFEDLVYIFANMTRHGWIDKRLEDIMKESQRDFNYDIVQSIVSTLIQYEPSERYLITIKYDAVPDKINYYKYDDKTGNLSQLL